MPPPRAGSWQKASWTQKLVDKSRWKYLAAGAIGRLKSSPQCPACGASTGEIVDRKFFHAFLCCSQCHLLHRFPAESTQQTTEFYEEGYAEEGFVAEFPSEQALEQLLATAFKGIPNRDSSYHIEILRALQLQPGGLVLDFGANWGYRTWQFRKAGFSADGFEISRSRAAFGKRLGIEICTDITKLEPVYDAVYSCHVLEHVPNPLATLQQQLALVREGGLVVAHTPNGSAAYRRQYPQSFHLAWGKVHAVFLTDRFVAQAFPNQPFLITSDDRPEEVRKWNQRSQVIGDCAGSGLFFAIRK
jgi:SAM-dependent methyltransferase